MAISYKRLHHLMIEKELSPVMLIRKTGISGNVFTRIRRNEYVSLESLEKICKALHCTLDEIVEFYDEE